MWFNACRLQSWADTLGNQHLRKSQDKCLYLQFFEKTSCFIKLLECKLFKCLCAIMEETVRSVLMPQTHLPVHGLSCNVRTVPFQEIRSSWRTLLQLWTSAKFTFSAKVSHFFHIFLCCSIWLFLTLQHGGKSLQVAKKMWKYFSWGHFFGRGFKTWRCLWVSYSHCSDTPTLSALI